MAQARRFTLPRAIHDWLTKPPSAAEFEASREFIARKRQAATYASSKTGHRVTFDMGPEAAAELAQLCHLALEDPAISESGKGSIRSSIKMLEAAIG